VVWDVDGTLVPADLRWLRRAVARTYQLTEDAVVFPTQRVHGYTDESIAVDTAVASGVAVGEAEAGVGRFTEILTQVIEEGRGELARNQPPYPGAADTIAALDSAGAIQTVLTGNLRRAAELKLSAAGLDTFLDLEIGGYGSDARDRFDLPAVVAERFAAKVGRPLVAARTVVVGDAPNDIACARHAGFRVVAVTHRLSREELAAHDPDAIVDRLDPRQLVDVIASLVS
jgi:phosphoglycolate phosphatase-like HAD superfamily hydrolase